ncbi:Permease of the drug/metabolite transporter (DMT) superfamily [Cognatiyoonia sediminum]|uniref:Permease of the drug/metabolite transporter (DMT) superfamily n=1 Tax=Cognatiyoonia sediminum TaxID=1508389 RepID=A0A1M5RJA8_9RHOB|nr:DMT family transporter [Cognatiyoonia sediminum]SHH26341.1 Permease of the drug/metabolite transporter (DMT) superfamily [Cognatiyoonia sediminum]
MSPNVRGALFALAAFAVFSTHDVIIKILGGTYSPIQVVFFSVLLSFPLATVMLMRDTTADTLIPRHPWWLALRTMAAVVTGVSAFYAFSVLPLAQTYAIIFASPLIITVLAIPVLGERVRLRRWIAVLVGLCGVLVVLRPGAEPLTLGHLAALAAALGGSVAAIVVRKIGAEERPVVMLLYPMVVNFVVMAALLPWVYEPMPIEHLGLLGIVALFAWTASRMIIVAYQSGEAAIIAPMQYSQILWASVYGFLFFDEIIDAPTAIGAGIIIASGLYIVLRESRTDASENTPVLRSRSRPETGTTPRVSLIMRARGKTPPR